MTKERRDSAYVAHKIVADAFKELSVPDHLKVPPKALPFLKDIHRSKVSWTGVDITHAVNLARCQAEIEDNQELLYREGNIIENARGAMIMNPRHSVLEQLTRRSVVLSRFLQIHSHATAGESKDQRKKNAMKQAALETFDDDDDVLLANPQ